jgi:hypothetical protein
MIAILLSLGMFVADLFKSRCRLEAENLEPAPRHLDRGALKAGRLGLCVPKIRFGIDGGERRDKLATLMTDLFKLVLVVVLGERHLCQLLKSYQRYYNEARTHLSLSKDAPVSRGVQAVGRILCLPILGGLHHQYVRI